MNKRYWILLIGMHLLVSEAWSQNQGILAGKVVDATSKKPLAFSTINLLRTNEGVITNFLGEFELSLSDRYETDTLYISMLGYKPLKIGLKSIDIEQYQTLALEENIILLEEVEVTEKSQTALDIVNQVIAAIPNNYPVSPYLLEGFTRSHKYECGRYVTLYEAAFSVYGQGYHKKSPERIYIDESRQSQYVPYYHSRVLRNNRNLFISMRHINDVLFRSYSLKTGQNQYEIKKYLFEGNRLIYVIETKHSKYVTHTLYVNADDLALLKVQMEMTTPEGEEWNPLLNKGPSSDSLDFKVTQISKTIQFEKRQGLYHAKYMDWLVEGQLYDQETNEEFCDWGFRFETMFDNVIVGDIAKPSKDKLMNPKSKSDPEVTPYNADFWKDYLPLKDFPITQKIVEDLEGKEALEVQFQQTKKR